MLAYVRTVWLRLCDRARRVEAFIPRRLPSAPRHSGFLPAKLFVLLQLMERAFKPTPFDVADMFAGRCAISKAYKAANMDAVALDIVLNPLDESWII